MITNKRINREVQFEKRPEDEKALIIQGVKALFCKSIFEGWSIPLSYRKCELVFDLTNVTIRKIIKGAKLQQFVKQNNRKGFNFMNTHKSK